MKVLLFCLFLVSAASASWANTDITMNQILEKHPEINTSDVISLSGIDGLDSDLKIEITIKRASDVKEFDSMLEKVIQSGIEFDPNQRFRLVANFENSMGKRYFEFDSDNVYELDQFALKEREERDREKGFVRRNLDKVDRWLKNRKYAPSSNTELSYAGIRIVLGTAVLSNVGLIGGIPFNAAIDYALVNALLSASFVASPLLYERTLLKQHAPNSKLWSANYLGMMPFEIYAKYWVLEFLFNVPLMVTLSGGSSMSTDSAMMALLGIGIVATTISHAQLFLEKALEKIKTVGAYKELLDYKEGKQLGRIKDSLNKLSKLMKTFALGALAGSAASLAIMGAHALHGATVEPMYLWIKWGLSIGMGGLGLYYIGRATRRGHHLLNIVAGKYPPGEAYKRIPDNMINELATEVSQNPESWLVKAKKFYRSLKTLAKNPRNIPGDVKTWAKKTLGQTPEEVEVPADFFERFVRVLNRLNVKEAKSCSRSTR